MTRPLRFLCIALFCLTAAAGAAQDARRGDDKDSRSFDFYVLALSWSPGFCALEGDRKGREQCRRGGQGFVVHGLWPQYERGYPSDCDSRPLPRAALQEAEGVFPDEGLARYEWRKHGTCSGQSPAAYFRDVRRARDQVRIPDAFARPPADQSTRAADIERAFAAANPGLRADMMAVACRRGVLQEVRVCFEKDLRGFRRCPEVDRAGCGFGPVQVNAVR